MRGWRTAKGLHRRAWMAAAYSKHTSLLSVCGIDLLDVLVARRMDSVSLPRWIRNRGWHVGSSSEYKPADALHALLSLTSTLDRWTPGLFREEQGELCVLQLRDRAEHAPLPLCVDELVCG